MKNRISLFSFGAFVAPESDTFMIEFGSQMTITAVGLEPGEYLEFQLVHIPSIDPDRCACPPGEVILPSVASFVTLTCCGEPIRVTPENPVVILDSPQRSFLRAVLSADPMSPVYAWAIESKTSDVSDRMRGCRCA